MKIDEYFAWWKFSGTGLGAATTGEKFEQLHTELSEPGAHCVILGQFLGENGDVFDMQAWRRTLVVGVPDLDVLQVKLTADALDAVGAKGTAATVRQVKGGMSSTMTDLRRDGVTDPESLMKGFLSGAGLDGIAEQFDGGDHEQMADAVYHQIMASLPPDLYAGIPEETRQEVESKATPRKQTPGTESIDEIAELANVYAAANSDALQSDVEKYGDPRLGEGFDESRFLEERERCNERLFGQRMQRNELPRLRSLLDTFREEADTKQNAHTTQKGRQILIEEHRHYATLPGEDLSDEMQDWIRDFERFRSDRPDAFLAKASGDEAINAKLSAIGPYETDFTSGMTRIEWSGLPELGCDWTTLKLVFDIFLVSERKVSAQTLTAGYDALIESWNAFKPRFVKLEPNLREHILEAFRAFGVNWLMDFQREDYQDADGEISDESILRHVNSGSIQLHYDGTGVEMEIFFDVDWDEEHGLPVEFDANGEMIRPF